MHPCITCYTGSFLRSARMFDLKQTVDMGCPRDGDMFAQGENDAGGGHLGGHKRG